MMKIEAAPPNDMNGDNNNYSNSDNDIGDDSTSQKQTQGQAWGTWEELLLACAVKRHGVSDWDSVAMEVRTRSSLPRLLTTAQNCKQKYRDLKRRFEERPADVLVVDGGDEEEERKSGTEDREDKVNSIPWLEQLRSLRVAELRRELQRYDVSILSLQLKVKKLEEERDRSVVDQKPDLDDDSKGERSENDGTKPARPNQKKVVPAEESDRENKSVNESNTTASGGKTGDDERMGGDGAGRTHEDSADPDPLCKAEAAEGSFSRGSEASHSAELGESTSVGLGRTRNRKGRANRSGKESLRAGNDGGGGGDEIRAAARKSQPLIGFLDIIRAHRHGALFERRFRSQESKGYKSLIRRHVDLGTIRENLEQGSYSSATLSFYRDLLLVFTNAIVFYPKSSSESLAAHELRTLVLNEMKKQTQKSDSRSPELPIPAPSRSDTKRKSKPEPDRSDSLLARQKSSGPLVACNKRSSVSTKPSSSSSLSQKDEKKTEEVSKEKEKIVTGTRSSRRNNKGNATVANNSNTKKKAASSNDNKQESPEVEKKTPALDKKKSVADFLKRIKSSPASSPKNGGNPGKAQCKSNGNGKKDPNAKERVSRTNTAEKKKTKEENTPLKQNTGRQLRKAAEPAASLGKRSRETGGSGGGKDDKQPKKRSRR